MTSVRRTKFSQAGDGPDRHLLKRHERLAAANGASDCYSLRQSRPVRSAAGQRQPAGRCFRPVPDPMQKLVRFSQQYGSSFSYVGLVVATLFFAASLTPSLLPRHFAVQGLLSGIALCVGYGVGVLLVLLWDYLELPRPGVQTARIGKWVTGVSAAIVMASFL